MESNPNYMNKKDAPPPLGEADMEKACVDSLALVGQVTALSALVSEDVSLLESSEAERASLAAVADLYNSMVAEAAKGSKAIKSGMKANATFAGSFAKLARAA